ncbi:aldo/keto reductase family oxidoreductase [Streptomyces virginiae]|uniref:aldo/keto reductase n=1 Tax=Streptomyces TaxID=1883 RepID=UPI001FCB8916|nr:aldo/keto reductase [Streptomyces virginiae]MCX4718512.1 aldo/keto reductase [Streptomyces virginiae]MCX5276150.1 aldo/keto reductase [Streptomyces virginiae]WSC75705.1 aldo/keto reductase [Streptomyces virginiae]
MTNASANPGGDRVLYGCMGLGGSWDPDPYGPADIDAAEAAVVAALDSGITTFDHADIYRHGKAEAVFGEVLARTPGLRERITLQTKCGIRLGDEDRPGMYDLRGESIARRVEESLTRLRTDVIDVLLLHRPDPLADVDETAAALTSLHRQGLVRGFGVSNMGAAQIAHLQARLDVPLVANQLEMSLHSRAWVEAGVLLNTPDSARNGFPFGTLEHCRDHGIRLQAWGALAQGRFTGLQETPAERATAALLTELARKKDTTPETVLLWWLMRHPAAIAPVIGSARPERIRACADAALREPELTHEEWYELWITARGVPLP